MNAVTGAVGEWLEMEPQTQPNEIEMVPVTFDMLRKQPGALAAIFYEFTVFQAKILKQHDNKPGHDTPVDMHIAAQDFENAIQNLIQSMPVFHEAMFHRHIEEGRGYYREHYDERSGEVRDTEYLNDWGHYRGEEIGGNGFTDHQERGDPWGDHNNDFPNRPPQNDPYYYNQGRQPHESNWIGTAGKIASLFG